MQIAYKLDNIAQDCIHHLKHIILYVDAKHVWFHQKPMTHRYSPVTDTHIGEYLLMVI